MPTDDLHRPVRQVPVLVLNEVQGGQELAVIAGELLSKDGSEALLIGAGHKRPQWDS